MLSVGKIFQRFTRSFRTTAVRKSGHDEPEGFPGANLPFSIENRYTLTAIAIAYIGSGFAIPFLLLRYHLTR